MKLFFLGLAVFAGAATAFQIPVNAGLRTHLSHPMQATLVSFSVGMLLSLAICLATATGVPAFQGIANIPWWAWTGGLLGTLYVGLSVVLSPRIGVAPMLSMVIAGQMLTSIIVDHYGLLNAPIYPMTAQRICGGLLVAIGAAVMAFGK